MSSHSQPQKPQQPPRPYVVRSHGVPIAIVIAHRPESAISTLVTNQYTAEVPSALELLELTRQNMQVIDPLGALPPAFGLPVGNNPPPESPQQQLPIGDDLGNNADPRRYTITYRSGDVLERIDYAHVIDVLEPVIGRKAYLCDAIGALTVGDKFDAYPEFSVERVATVERVA